MRLLVTRPEPDGERTAAELRARGHEVTLAPLLRIEPAVDADLGPGPWAALLLTSANGARAVAAHVRHRELIALPALAVGRASADAARAAGFSDVVSADGDGRDLARLAAARFRRGAKPLLYVAGEDRARDLGGELAALGLSVQTAVAYRAVPATRLPAPVLTALELAAIDGVLHFSRRSAQAYAECAGPMLRLALAPIHFCLSQRVSEPLAALGADRIRVAPRPDEAALLAMVTPRP